VSSVKRAISQLIEEGWIRVESQKAKRNMYFVEWDRISATKNQDDEYVFNEEKGSPMSPIWAQSGQEKGSPMSP
jgi:ribosomal protein S4